MIPTGPRYPPLFPALARRKLRSRSAHTATERHSCLSVTAGRHGRSGLDDRSSGRNPERLSRSLLTGLILGRAAARKSGRTLGLTASDSEEIAAVGGSLSGGAV